MRALGTNLVQTSPYRNSPRKEGVSRRTVRRGFAVLLIAGLTLLPQPAAARWEANIERDDFGTNHVGLAATMSGRRGLVLRCGNDAFASWPAVIMCFLCSKLLPRRGPA